MTDQAPLLRIATWNIHDSVGTDGRRDLHRVADVLRTLDASIIGLQEAACDPGGSGDVAALATLTDLKWRAIPTRSHRNTHCGNALLTSLPILRQRRFDLSIEGREPRAALEVDLRAEGRRVRVVVTHLGLGLRERRQQVTRLLAELRRDDADVTVLLGDINEWFMWGRPLRWIDRAFGRHHARATFPSRWPALALDRVWAHPPGTVADVQAVRTPAARRASDHLPLVATLRLPPRRQSFLGEVADTQPLDFPSRTWG